MEFGLIMMFDDSGNDTASVYRHSRLTASHARSAGFSTLWLTEHHGNPTRLCPSIPLMMGYLAHHTPMTLGAATILLSHYSSRHIAEEIGMLTHMYPNRFAFGFAKGGGSEVMLHDNGDENHARRTMIDRLGEVHTFLHGSAKQPLYPSVQTPPPLYIASKEPESIRYAARNGIGIMAGHKWTLEETAEVAALYQEEHPLHHAPDLMLSRFFLLGETHKSALSSVTDAIAKRREKMEPLRESRHNNQWREGVLEEESPIGELQDIEKLFRRYRDMGVTRLALRPATADSEATFNSIQHIRPLIRSYSRQVKI
ncbi:LLM class flavin-dependent oxidoreductase [uncultured Sulfuricurvum sp.]|uniref:LLM class flavin-dependent oxidoreductase n=2 Tax=Sulfuricurvum TaxID=286130 RepID=UPI002639E410|nr:LLM class flavin-dependent oxidoreductase [uncultured Sulfuricurvum sp.]